MRAQVLPSYEFVRQRWHNGRGWTREIARQPAQGEFDWRLSIAEIDQAGEFSPFPGKTRVLVLLHGEALELEVDGATHSLTPPHGRLLFSGDAAVRCMLPAGPAQAFNLIYATGRIDAELLHRPLVGPMVFFDSADIEWMIYLLQGQAELASDEGRIPLAAGDAVRLSGEGSDRRTIIDGGGELLLVRFSAPRAA